MAEEASGEKVFPATARKRQEARKKGQVARSPELSGALVLLAMVCALRVAVTHGAIFGALQADLHSAFAFSGSDAHGFDSQSARLWQLRMTASAAWIVAPALLAALALGLVTNVAQVGLHLTPEMLLPDFNRVNPLNAIKRVFSARGAVELAKAVLKIGLIGWICWSTVAGRVDLIARAMALPFTSFLSQVGDLLWSLAVHVCSALFILAVADYAYQKYDFEKTMRMSREELKQEQKTSDGDPAIKQRIRQKQRAMAQKRMMEQVPKATVVVTNPTHFAVALRYDKGMAAPIVVARGQDHVALRIKEIAREHAVPTVENRAVARALYHDVRIGHDVPPALYKAVAEILAFVYRTKPASRPRALAASSPA